MKYQSYVTLFAPAYTIGLNNIQVEALLEGSDDYENKEPLVMAKEAGGKAMEATVQKRITLLKVRSYGTLLA